MERTRVYRNGVLEAESFPVADISDHLAVPGTVVWLDLCAPDQDDLAAVSEEFGLHPLAVEDAIHEHQRPKLDRYQTHLFLSTYAVSLDIASGELQTSEVAVFVTKRARPLDVQRRSFELRKSLVLLRRVVLPMREVVNALMRRDYGLLDPPMVPFYQDVYDHVLRATEWTESLRDLVTTIADTNLTIQGNRLNSITKKVTGWAAIIAVPTAVTGFYGQNIPYPGFGQPWGFWVSTAITIALSVGLYFMFKARDWI